VTRNSGAQGVPSRDRALAITHLYQARRKGGDWMQNTHCVHFLMVFGQKLSRSELRKERDVDRPVHYTVRVSTREVRYELKETKTCVVAGR